MGEKSQEKKEERTQRDKLEEEFFFHFKLHLKYLN